MAFLEWRGVKTMNNKYDINEIEHKIKRYTKIGLSLIILMILIFGTFYIVPAGHRGIILTLGKVDMNVKGEGLNIKVPLIQKAIIMDVKTQKYQAELGAASKDLQDVTTIIAINYRLTESKVSTVYQTIGLDYSEKVIFPMEQEANKAVTAEFTAEEMITKREQVRAKMKELLSERLLQRNIILEDISIVNFKFSESFTAAIEAKVTAEQNALREENNLKVVDFQAKQKVRAAEGDAEAIRIVNTQLTTSPQYIQYYLLQKWNGVMPVALGSNSLLSITGTTNE